MSDPSANLEIQDVLSSIRRLVSQDKRAATKVEERDDSPAANTGGGKLVLTDALRVPGPEEEDEDTLRQNITGDGVYDDAPAAVVDLPDTARSAGTLEDTIAELEAAVAGIGEEFEPDGSEVIADDAPDSALEEAFAGGFDVDVGADIAPPAAGAEADGEAENGAAGHTGKEVSADVTVPEEAPEDGPAPVMAAPAAERTRRLHLTASEMVDQGAPWDRSDATDPDPAPPVFSREATTARQVDEEAPAAATNHEEAQGVDEDILHDIVVDIIRRELQGQLGEKITRNVRMLVRREINRALESRNLD